MGEGLIFIAKIILAVVISPVVYSCALNFYDHLDVYPTSLIEFFRWGVFGFVLVFLFVYPFRYLYQFGQNVMTGIFKFLTPLDRAVARVVPFFTVVILASFYIAGKFFDITAYVHYFMFFAGFSMAMHILLLAQELQGEEASFIKSSYFLRMSVYFVLSVCMTVLLLDLAVWKWTFLKFFSAMFEDARDIYMLMVRRIL
ncbi:MAG: hypothetical protein A3D87_08410 [Omnitrophica WOR_2 bacterium RIFCSPHIGHO2_02_FULL_50_17]|nr:MAG: hypothetical protein A3D87_08410 [Omnitrophica WOR_2 bacterium RIFCSPHIGHO2_02_FULL_50_17]